MSRESYKAPIHLTQRGRLARTMVGGVAIAGLWYGGEYAAKTIEAKSEITCSDPQEPLIVQPGDTIWEIATRHSETTDTHTVVDEIERQNNVSPSEIRPGMLLMVSFNYDAVCK